MTRSLMTGISGLRTHQQKLDVVANNLANMNTVGYKTQSTVFSDLMYGELSRGSRATAEIGGRNPMSIGSGVQLAQIRRDFDQGALQTTGQMLDFAIQGDGFFTLAGDTGQQVYSRAGSFSVDALGRLVDPSTGMLVQRFGSLGESETEGLNLQVPGDNSIQVPIGASVPGDLTSQIDFIGNLPADSLPPTAEVLSSYSPFTTASGPADLTTTFNDLTINGTPYGPGDLIEINGTNPDGTPFTTTLAADTSTLGDLVNELNTQLTGATAALEPDGTLSITSDTEGEAFLSLSLEDSAGNVGSSNFASNSMVVSTEGFDGATYELSVDVFDKRGQAHRMVYEFMKRGVNSWDIRASVSPESGTMIEDEVMNLTFNEDGTYALVGGDSDGPSVTVQFNSVSEPSEISLDFGQMTHMATGFSMTQSQDGFPPGTLSSISVSADGILNGLASNGRVIPIAQLALASFANEEALEAIGNNYFQESTSSGAAAIGEALAGGRGNVVGGQLEGSNVDIALEFTQLIVAQRGFSANARTITVSDEMLEELTNIIR